MNRRSAIKTAIGACVAMLLPWRAASGARKPEEDQVERIKRLLEAEEQRNQKLMHSLLPKLEAAKDRWAKSGDADGAIETVTYRPFVQSQTPILPGEEDIYPEPLGIVWEEQEPDSDGLYGCGLVRLSNELAASMDDRELTRKLKAAFLVAISPRYVSRQKLLGHFNGKPVWIRKGEAIGAEFNRTDADSLIADFDRQVAEAGKQPTMVRMGLNEEQLLHDSMYKVPVPLTGRLFIRGVPIEPTGEKSGMEVVFGTHTNTPGGLSNT